MPNNPHYVRLPEGPATALVDTRSGWGITGFDVKKFPDREEAPEAYRFVRQMVRKGRLEGASKSEWDEVHAVDLEQEEIPKIQMVTDTNTPEYLVQRGLKEKSKALKRRRAERAAAADQPDLEAEEEEDQDETRADNTDAIGRAGDAQRPSAREKRDAKRRSEATERKTKSKAKGSKKRRDEEETSSGTGS